MKISKSPGLVASLRFALDGLRHTFERERNFRTHCALAVLACGLGWLCGLPRPDFLWVGLAITLVLVAELFNTAVESLVDIASPVAHPLAKAAKDAAAAAVLVSSLFAVVVGLLIFGPHLGWWQVALFMGLVASSSGKGRAFC
ncbi:MAG: diacylglycerol kinase family protein [Candidatus Eremiobacteraeota bacterium]|nr:diacylglycerol kinase family protein [Candidatus Eremiobacteraeota bacterium]